jgi:hypothetical protein
MSKRDIKTWQDCRDGRRVRNFLRRNDYDVTPGNGDHYNVHGPDGRRLTTLDGDKQSNRVARNVFKALAAAGLLTALFAATLTALMVAFL